MKNQITLIILTILVSRVTSTASICDVVGGTIWNDIVLEIPADYPNIEEALECKSEKRIMNGAIVTIHVADGNYTYDNSIRISHEDGGSIHILGNPSNPSSVTLAFPNGTNGISVMNGHKLGLLDGFKIVGSSSTGNGIYAKNLSSINVGENVTIDSFQYGVFAEIGSSIICDGMSSTNNGLHGFSADKNSTLICNNTLSSNNGGDGYRVSFGSVMEANYATSSNNSADGFISIHKAIISANNTISTSNRWGYNAYAGSLIMALASTASNNTQGSYIPDTNTHGHQDSFIQYMP